MCVLFSALNIAIALDSRLASSPLGVSVVILVHSHSLHCKNIMHGKGVPISFILHE